jgi:hypothetical protein
MGLSTFEQDLVKVGVQAVGVGIAGGLSLLVGWLLLRPQERIKRKEESWARIRKLRADALVKSLEALGRYHNLKDRRIRFLAERLLVLDEMEKLNAQEHAAYEQAIDTQANLQFLLGPHAVPLGECIRAMAAAGTTGALSEAGRAAARHA